MAEVKHKYRFTITGQMDKDAYLAAMEYNIEQIKTMED